jgi:hypothetical protein
VWSWSWSFWRHDAVDERGETVHSAGVRREERAVLDVVADDRAALQERWGICVGEHAGVRRGLAK